MCSETSRPTRHYGGEEGGNGAWGEGGGERWGQGAGKRNVMSFGFLLLCVLGATPADTGWWLSQRVLRCALFVLRSFVSWVLWNLTGLASI